MIEGCPTVDRAATGGASVGAGIIEVVGLKKYFPITRGVFRGVVGHLKAVNDVSFSVAKGEVVGLVGESGCGKTTTGRCIVRLIDPTGGHVYFGGRDVDLARLRQRDLKKYRPRIQMIFQDPYSSLNPRMTVGEIIGEPLRVNGVCAGRELEDRVQSLLKAVELRGDCIRRYPHAFSGGQRQRIGIARALALNPELIIADEPVSALDVSVQAQVLNLMLDLRKEHGLSFIFIAHDLSVVQHFSDRVAVMYLGSIVEISGSAELYARPRHPYTESLMSSIPVPDPAVQRSRQRIKLEGEVPDIARLPSGCPFHPRCRFVKDMCRVEMPALREVAPGVRCACHRSEEISLQGVS